MHLVDAAVPVQGGEKQGAALPGVVTRLTGMGCLQVWSREEGNEEINVVFFLFVCVL